MFDILQISYLLFLICIVIREVIYIYKVRDIRIISAVRLMYALIYGLIPVLVLGDANSATDAQSSTMIGVITWPLFIISIFVYLLIGVGYHIKHTHKPRNPEIVSTGENILFFLSVFITIVGVVSLYLWSRAYGGPAAMMRYAAYIRSGYVIRENSLTFFKRFANLSTMGAYIAFSLLIDKSNKLGKKIVCLVLLIINTYVKIMYSLIDDGRMTAAIFVVGFLGIALYRQYREGKVPMRSVIVRFLIIALGGYVLIIFSNPIMNYIRVGNFNMTWSDFDLFSSLRRELGYTYSSSRMALQLRFNGYQYTFLRDWISGLFSYLPTRFTPAYARIHLTYINSVNLYGPSVQYGSPPDFISVCLYDLGIIGLIVYPLVFGFIIRKLDKFFEDYKSGIWGTAVYICVIFRVARIIANAAMYNVALSVFHIVVTSIMYWVFQRIKISRYKKL